MFAIIVNKSEIQSPTVTTDKLTSALRTGTFFHYNINSYKLSLKCNFTEIYENFILQTM